MSLGSQLLYKIRSLFASNQIVVTPRDPLLLLNLRCFGAVALTGSESHHPTADTSEKDTSENEVQRLSDVRSAISHQDLSKAYLHRHLATNAASTLSPNRSRSKEHTLHSSSTIAPSEQNPKSHEMSWTDPGKIVNQEVAARNTGGPKTAHEDLLKGVKHNSEETFQLAPAQINIMARRVKTVKRYREHNSITSSMIKSKGTWSYDWRIPLLELRQHFQADQCSIIASSEITRIITHYHEYRAMDIPRPSAWSQESFAVYVKELALSKVSRVMQRHLYGTNQSHVYATRDVLLALFQDDSMRPCLTPLAFENAMMFFYRYGMVHSCRKLFNLMTTLEIPIFPSTFNLMLRAAAEKKDLHNFTYLLRAMIRMGVKPNENTWVAFIAAISSKVIKIAIIKQMRELGLLERVDIVQAVVVELLPTEISSHVESGLDLNVLIEHLDSKYSGKWLSTVSGNIMCRKLGELGRISDIVKVLDIMLERNCRPDKLTLSILLTHCTRVVDGDLALRFLALFQNRYGVCPNVYHFHALFMLAWRSRRYNMCKVVWQAACVKAAVSYRMQELVMRSLLRNTPRAPCKPREQWMKEAGKVMIGVGLGRPEWPQNKKQTQAMADTHKVRTILELATYAEGRELRTYRLARAKALLAADLAASSNYRLSKSFLSLLDEALKLDYKWQKEDRWKISIYRKLHKAIWTGIEPKVRRFLGRKQQKKVLWSRPRGDAHSWDWSSRVKLISDDVSSFP